MSAGVIVCGPPRSIPAKRSIAECPFCKTRRRMVTTYDGYYYGTTTYCYTCNGYEQDGDWRPASPDDRYAKENRAYITGRWNTGVRAEGFYSAVRAFERHREAL